MSRESRSKPKPSVPSRARRLIHLAVAVLALLGLAEAAYLTALHLAGAHVVCITAANCSQVLASSYAAIAGVPLAGIGAVGYFAVFSLAVLVLFGYRHAAGLLALAVSAMFLTALWLLYVQAFILHAFCDYCLFSAAIIFLLAGLLVALPPSKEG